MKVALASDERTSLTDFLVRDLEQRGHEVLRFGAIAEGDAALEIGESMACDYALEGGLPVARCTRTSHRQSRFIGTSLQQPGPHCSSRPQPMQVEACYCRPADFQSWR